MIKSPISWIIAIAQRGKGKKVAKIFGESGINVRHICLGHGTANSEIMDYLGLDEPEKDVVLGLSLNDCVCEAFSRLADEMGFLRSGMGIAFSIPVTSINQAAAEKIDLQTDTERSCKGMEEKFELVVVYVDKGMTDIVMDSAKAAGARGGTVVRGRAVGETGERHVFGVTLQQEKEILMMVMPKKDKEEIMKAVCATVRDETGSETVAFSVPIDDVVGIHGA
ncbi:MAG: hypothetical protein AB7D36_07600 [Oscillospiraceae bacterium]